MNTGHNFRKLGESYVGFLNRIWIANQGSFKVAKSREQDLVLDLINRGYKQASVAFRDKYDHKRCLLRAANHYENSLNLGETKPTAEIYADSFIKNCPECAQIGYHSNYFNTSWLKVCPVHERRLTTDCPTCNRLWAGPSQIRVRSCEDCGPRMSFNQLAERDAFDSEVYTKQFTLLENYFESPSPMMQVKVVHTDFVRKTRYVDTNHLFSEAYPSFVAINEEFDDAQLSELNNLQIKRFPMESINFSYEKECALLNPVDAVDIFRDAIVEVRQKVLKLASRELLNSKDLEHPVAHCELEYFRRPVTCAVCSTHKIIEARLPDPKFDYGRELFHYQSIEDFDHAAPEPGVISGVEVNGKLLPFPEEISMLLYKIDLWTQIRIMYYKLDRSAQAELPRGMTLVDWGEQYPDLAKGHGSYSFPFFVARNGSSGKLYIPRTFLNTSISVDADFRELIF